MKTMSLVAALLVLSSTAHAQQAAAPATALVRGCLESIPQERFTRVVVSASLTMTDSRRHAVPATAGNLLQLLVNRVEPTSGA